MRKTSYMRQRAPFQPNRNVSDTPIRLVYGTGNKRFNRPLEYRRREHRLQKLTRTNCYKYVNLSALCVLRYGIDASQRPVPPVNHT